MLSKHKLALLAFCCLQPVRGHVADINVDSSGCLLSKLNVSFQGMPFFSLRFFGTVICPLHSVFTILVLAQVYFFNEKKKKKEKSIRTGTVPQICKSSKILIFTVDLSS